MTKYKLLFYFTAIFFVSCSDNKKESVKDKYEIRWDKINKLDTLNQEQGLALSKKFDAITNKDSTIKFTYQLQYALKKYNKPISLTGYINDITSKDSNYILKIYGTFLEQKCFGEILVPPQQFYELNKKIDPKSSRIEGCFIFKASNIKSSSILAIDSKVSTDGNAETVDEANSNASSELTYDYHDVLLFFKGNLIDFYIYRELPNDDN